MRGEGGNRILFRLSQVLVGWKRTIVVVAVYGPNNPSIRKEFWESPVCKRLDRFLYSNEWELSFPQSLQEVLLDGHQITGRLSWILIHSSGDQTPFSLRICGCNIIISKRALAVGGENLKEMVGKLFHKVANGRRNKNFIKFLENERGLVLDNSESITEEILLYFKKLYSSPPGESWRVEDRDKAPGPDGFTIAVFQDCWDVIKEDLVRVFAEFHNRDY
ncbi:hypothetical protein CK203_056966 [Vitis vinifera]|uniref:Uncharacterized protein n=1 Tax=Vitis vinifera TaxID=29760 RepID=A0A438GN26_VITVI|nr:hypothetical protein CK203_056966 [Vitis vinifera]